MGMLGENEEFAFNKQQTQTHFNIYKRLDFPSRIHKHKIKLMNDRNTQECECVPVPHRKEDQGNGL